MEFTTFFGTTFAAFLTLAIMSFLYKDNPFYKFAEHAVVGTSAGYFVIILWHNGLVPNLFRRLADGDWYLMFLNSSAWYYIIPALIGTLMWTRFSKQYSWVSRWPMALYIGISTGAAIPREMSAKVSKQLYATMSPINWSDFWGSGWLDTSAGYSDLIVFACTLCAIVYFFFSKAHTGAFGGLAKVGIWTLMIGFGASFGFTVMARISLFIQRIQFMDQGWAQHALNITDTPNPNHDWKFEAMFWVLALGVLAYAVTELVKHLKSKDQPTQTT